MDEMAPVMDLRQEEKEVRAGLRRRYLRQRLSPVDTSLRVPTRRDLTVVTTAQNLRRQEDADEVEDGDDSDDEEAAAGNARQGTKNRQGKDVDSDDDDDDDEDYRNNQPVATLALPEPETPSPTAQTFPPPQLAPSTSTTLMAPASPTTPATPPTPTFPVLPLPPPPVITLPPTTVVMTSTVMATPKPSANAPVVNNPQVESPPPSTTSTSISLMTTQPLSLVSSISVSSQPRKGVGNPETTSSPTSSPTSTETTETTPFAFEKSTPTPTPSLEDVRNGNDGGRDQDRGPPRGLDPAAEHALIGAGSIGGFIIVCFICWMVWRMVKKSKAKENGYYGNQPPPSNQLFAKIPYFGRGQRGWQEMDDGPSPPPHYEKTNSMGQISEIYSMYDPRSQAQSMSKQGPLVLPQLQTNFSPSGNFNNNPFSATSGSIQNPHSASSPLRMQTASPQSQMSQQPLTNMPLQLQPGFSPASNFNPFAGNTPVGSNSMSSNNMLHYGSLQNTGTMQSVGTTQAMGTMQTIATTTTDRSRMQDPFFNQSELARQPSDAYDPNRRQVYRASELSSLSSGFGDEDIIVPPPAATRQPGGPSASRLSYQQTPGASRKNSVANASEAGNSNRDTVYTTTSEDMPPRFRTVSSWVNQQTGRVRRAEQRADEDIPPVPSMPAEERYTMMMDDEEPRRPDAAAAPVPDLPAEFKDTKP